MAQRWHQKNRPLVVHRSRRGPYTPQLFYALCGLFSVVLARWDGGGRDNIEGAKFSAQSKKAAKDEASDKPEAFTRALLNVLCFSTSLLPATRAILQSDPKMAADLNAIVDVNKAVLKAKNSKRAGLAM